MKVCRRRLSLALSPLLVAGLIAGGADSRADENHTTILQKTGKAFAEVSKRAIPAVVFIHVEKTIEAGLRRQSPFFYNDPFNFFGDDFMRRFFGGQPPNTQPRRFKQQGQGSGFLISKDGYILTNNHVVGDADKITVKLHDGKEYQATKIGADPKSEVAVIKIQGDDYPCLPLGSSAVLEIGEWVIAIGNPFGLSETVTVGVVSAKGRSNIGIADYEDFIQTDAAINPGNSGGPLLNIAGEVVGINTAIFSRSGGYMGIGFAIPVDMAKTIKEQLVATGKVVRGYLGVYIKEVDESLAKSFNLKTAEGILVDDVSRESAAEKAGIHPGDIILMIDGRKVGNVPAFRNRISSNPPGTKFTLTIFRELKKQDIEVITGTLPDAEELASTAVGDFSERSGLTVQELTRELAQRFGYDTDEGIIVTQVAQDSPAAQVGLRPGNLIVGINREPVSNLADFERLVSGLQEKDTVLVRVKDGERAYYVVITLEG